jgi:hypothetical protein
MKKIIFCLTLILIGFGKINAQNVTVENGAIKFSSIEIFEQYAENKLERNDIVEVSNSIKPFSSEAKENEEDPYPDFLKSILNSEKIFAIKNSFIKMDLENQRAFVISNTVEDAYNTLLTSNAASSDVLLLGIDENYALDILEALENKTITVTEYNNATEGKIKWPWNSCSGGRDRDAKQIYLWGETKDGYGTKPIGCIDGIVHFAMDNKLVYQAAIFYFSIQSKSKSLKGCGSSNWIGVPHYDTYQYLNVTAMYATTKDCKTNVSVANTLTHFGFVLDWRPYEGGRALTRYRADATFGAKYFDNTPANFILAPPLHIEYGY